MQHQIWILVVCLYAASHSATYYVATNGSNSAGGTAEASKSGGSARIGCRNLDWIAKSAFTVACRSNPSHPSIVIYYQLPNPADVRIEIFSQNGRRRADLENGFRSAGPHRVTWKDRRTTGYYIIKLTAGEYRAVRKVMIKK